MDRELARSADEQDPISWIRGEFELPEDIIYLDGNSLGPMPRRIRPRMDQLLGTEWARDLIGSWNTHHWISLPLNVGEKIAPIIGAAPGQVIASDSVSINLFKLLAAGLQMRPGRTEILTEIGNFPTDLYMAQGLRTLLGDERVSIREVESDEIPEHLSDDTAILMLTQTNFRTGALHDMGPLTEAAHRSGALTLWDLSHSAGVIPLSLDHDDVDMAVGCGYKFLNGGPGAPAFLYMKTSLQSEAIQPLTGWMGHSDPFRFDSQYSPGPGMHRFLSGTPNILSLTALDEALSLFDQVSIQTLRDKSMALSDAFVEGTRRLDQVELISPPDASRRGSQVSLRHPEGYAIMQALIARGVIGDFRNPDVLRFGFSPMFLRFADISDSLTILEQILTTRIYLDPVYSQRSKVT